MSLVQLTTVRALPIVAGGLRVSTESQALMIRLPIGGGVWHRPTAVIVEQAGRGTQRLPILDLTRLAQFVVFLGTLLVTVVWLIVSARQQEA